MEGLTNLFDNLITTGPDFWLGVLLIVVAAYPVPQALGPLMSYLIDFLKLIGLVKDNQAGKWNALLSFILAAGLAWLVRAGLPEEEANTYIGLATQALALIALAVQTFKEAAKTFAIRKNAGVAFSNSARNKLLQAQRRTSKR